MHNAYRISNHNHNEIDKSTSTFVFIQNFSFAFLDYYYLSFIIQYEAKQWYTYFLFQLRTSYIQSLCHLIFIRRFFAPVSCSMNQFFYLVHVSCENNNINSKKYLTYSSRIHSSNLYPGSMFHHFSNCLLTHLVFTWLFLVLHSSFHCSMCVLSRCRFVDIIQWLCERSYDEIDSISST